MQYVRRDRRGAVHHPYADIASDQVHRARTRRRAIAGRPGWSAGSGGRRGGPSGCARIVRPTLILTAVELEAHALARHLGLPPLPAQPCRALRHAATSRWLAVGLRRRPSRLALARLLAGLDHPLVVSAGVCGGLDPALTPGTLVVSRGARRWRRDRFERRLVPGRAAPGSHPRGTLVDGARDRGDAGGQGAPPRCAPAPSPWTWSRRAISPAAAARGLAVLSSCVPSPTRGATRCRRELLGLIDARRSSAALRRSAPLWPGPAPFRRALGAARAAREAALLTVARALASTRRPGGDRRLHRRDAGGSRRLMDVLVTGATGFVGRQPRPRAAPRGGPRRVLARRGGDRRALAGLALEVAEGDLLDAASRPRRRGRRARRVYHVAADYRLWARDPRPLFRANVDGTRHVLRPRPARLARRASSTPRRSAPLGIPKDGTPGDGTTPVSLADMVGPYKASKFLAEQRGGRVGGVAACPS